MSPRTVVTFHAQDEQRRVIEEVLAPSGGVAFLQDVGEDAGARAALLGAAEVLLAWFPNSELSQDEVKAAGRVGFIQVLSAGADHIDFAALPAQARLASNVGAWADPMAEHVLAMALSLAKRLPRNHARMAAGHFEIAWTLRLRGGVAGILGYGGIGRASARLFRPFGMRIHAINTCGRAEDADWAGTLAELDELLAAANIVVVSLPLTRATRGLIGVRELSLMKNDAILVNVARGAIVDEDALFQHLRSHPEFSAGIDTWWEEPHGRPFHPRLPFFDLPNLLGSPHNSGFVPGVITEATAAAAGNVAAHLRGDPPRGVQDPADYQAVC